MVGDATPGLFCPPLLRNRQGQRGLSLVVVMLILIVVSVLGAGGVQIAMMAERGTRNDRDMQIAWQAAEAGLLDAEFDIEGIGTNPRRVFKGEANDTSDPFTDACGNSGTSIGLCNLKATGNPAWMTVDFEETGSTAKTVEFGTFTGRIFQVGAAGIQPARKPRYLIERTSDRYGMNSSRTSDPASSNGKTPSYVYRVTAMGFGPNKDTQAVLQMIYRN